ncbi:hypothetical protein POM88_047486 [Heracleum sosnowskyi]|uniref:Uncharacterized protein n=1 Tax=Heracleum sosnowskyi TaxID=360622 RepID=A0AAD8LXL7_9APIA|nr:hypothetical protein POM88_047481 [Heracleum sosnowskyi]KAK1354230.1 hypothetical protein POM88_047486 [Heracleum sosnowskyi]
MDEAYYQHGLGPADKSFLAAKVHEYHTIRDIEASYKLWCLNDGTPDVRDAAFSALAKLVGMRSLENSLEKLDEVRKMKLSEMIGSSGGGPPAAARSAAVKSSSGSMRCSEMYKIMKEHKNPKVLSEGLLWMVTADLIDFCKDAGLQSSAPATRNSTIKVIGALHKFVGPDSKGFLSDVKPALLSTLDAEYEKNPFEGASAAPKKLIRKFRLEICMESIEGVNKILEEANKRFKPTGTGELFGAVSRLYDSNKN